MPGEVRWRCPTTMPASSAAASLASGLARPRSEGSRRPANQGRRGGRLAPGATCLTRTSHLHTFFPTSGEKPCCNSDPVANAATRTCRPIRRRRASAPSNAPSAPTAPRVCWVESAPTAAALEGHLCLNPIGQCSDCTFHIQWRTIPQCK